MKPERETPNEVSRDLSVDSQSHYTFAVDDAAWEIVFRSFVLIGNIPEAVRILGAAIPSFRPPLCPPSSLSITVFPGNTKLGLGYVA